MDILHSSSSPLYGTAHDGDRGNEINVHATVTSITDDRNAVERNNISATVAFFAPYQPPHRTPYDIGNCFDRTNLALIIRRHIDRAEDYIALARRLHSAGLMNNEDFAQRVGERCAHLREHRNALFRLNELGRN